MPAAPAVKLLTTTNRYYLGLVAVLFVLGSGILYSGVQLVLAHEVDEQLSVHRTYMIEHIRSVNQLPPITNPKELAISRQPRAEGFGDTVQFDQVEQTQVPFRTVTFVVRADGQRYWITLRKSLIETEDVLQVVMAVMLTVMGLLFGSVLLLNRWLSFRLWTPFYNTLAALRGYRLQQKPVSLELPASAIAEFSELNYAVAELTQRVAADYQSLKEFTENAAHETQTPLAIMQAKLEQLMQLTELPAAAVPAVQELYRATLRLSRLHQALSLLSRIENRQFTGAVPLRLDEVVADKLEQLQDFMEAKQLEPRLHIAESLTVMMHPALADSLVGNLLQNAVKHNYRGGQLQIRLAANLLEVSNSGPALTTNPMQLVGRFRKHNAASDSPGLGLAIVQQICSYYGFHLSYSVGPDASQHTLRVDMGSQGPAAANRPGIFVAP